VDGATKLKVQGFVASLPTVTRVAGTEWKRLVCRVGVVGTAADGIGGGVRAAAGASFAFG